MIARSQTIVPSILPFALVSGLFFLALGFMVYLQLGTHWLFALVPGVATIIVVAVIWVMQLLQAPVHMHSRKNLNYGFGLTVFACFILWFAYLQIPLFHMVCHRFGIHGGVEHHHQASQHVIDTSRTIPIHFTSLVMQGMPCNITLDQKTSHWHPGDHYRLGVTINNPSDQTLIVHPLLSASPERSSLSLHFKEGLPDPLVLTPYQSFHQSLEIDFDHDFPQDIKTLFFSISLSNKTNAENPGKQNMWYQIRTRYASLKRFL